MRTKPSKLLLGLSSEELDEVFQKWMNEFIEQNKGDIYFTVDRLRTWIRYQKKCEVSGQALSRNIHKHKQTFHIKVYGYYQHSLKYTIKRTELEDTEIIETNIDFLQPVADSDA